MLLKKYATSITPKKMLLFCAQEIEILIDQSKTIPQDMLKTNATHKRSVSFDNPFYSEENRW